MSIVHTLTAGLGARSAAEIVFTSRNQISGYPCANRSTPEYDLALYPAPDPPVAPRLGYARRGSARRRVRPRSFPREAEGAPLAIEPALSPNSRGCCLILYAPYAVPARAPRRVNNHTHNHAHQCGRAVCESRASPVTFLRSGCPARCQTSGGKAAPAVRGGSRRRKRPTQRRASRCRRHPPAGPSGPAAAPRAGARRAAT